MHFFRPGVAAATAIVTLLLTIPGPAEARRRRGGPSLIDRVEALEQDVQNTWMGLSRMAEDFLPKPLDTDRTLWHVARGEMAWHTGKPLLAAVHLFKAVRQQSFREHRAYPEALYFLSEALFDLQMDAMAKRLLAQALTHGEENRHFKAMLASYLEVGWQSKDERIDAWVRVYRDRWMNRPAPGPDDIRVRYFLAKVFIDRSRADVARALLEGIPEEDPLSGRARYLTAITHVMEGEHEVAAGIFEAVARSARSAERQAWELRVSKARTTLEGRKLKPKTAKTERRPEGPAPAARTLYTLVDPGFEGAAEASEEEQVNAALGMEAALSRARLAMVEGDPDTAWLWYRWIPAGADRFREVLDESIWCALARKRYSEAVALTQLLVRESGAHRGGRGDAKVLRAHLLAEAGQFEESERMFVEAMAELQAAVPEIQAAGDGLVVTPDGLIQFDERIATWTDPRELEVAVAQVRLLNERLVEVVATKDMLATLGAVAEDPSTLPSVQEAHARGDHFRNQITTLRDTVSNVRKRAARGSGGSGAAPSAGAGGDGASDLPPGIAGRLESVDAWIKSLDQHLTFYMAAIDSDGRRQASMIGKVVKEETVRLAAIEAEVSVMQRSALEAAQTLATGAVARIEDLFMKAELGATGVSFRRKEWITQQIDALYAKKKSVSSDLTSARAEANADMSKTGREVAYPSGLDAEGGVGGPADRDDDYKDEDEDEDDR